jgi:hypothetical protein
MRAVFGNVAIQIVSIECSSTIRRKMGSDAVWLSRCGPSTMEPKSGRGAAGRTPGLCENPGIDSRVGVHHATVRNRGALATGFEKHHHKLKGVPLAKNRGALATGSGNAIRNSKVYHTLGSRFGSASHATWTRSSVVAWFLFQCGMAFLYPVAKAPRFCSSVVHL